MVVVLATVMRYMADVYKSGWVILTAGVGGGTLVTLLWIVLLKYCVKPLTYLTLLMAGTFLVAAALLLLYKGGLFASVPLPADITATANRTTLFTVAEPDDQWIWNICPSCRLCVAAFVAAAAAVACR